MGFFFGEPNVEELTEGKALAACAKEVTKALEGEGYQINFEYFTDSYAIENGGFWAINLYLTAKSKDSSSVRFKAYCERYRNGTIKMQDFAAVKK